ncbi:TonB-dependent receptor [Sphingomonas oleivorans]|nr:TonB-dependent receptor [Sphingomonas oleivorans]
MKRILRTALLCSVVSVAAAAGGKALAQQLPTEQPAEAADQAGQDGAGLGLDEIVVTGNTIKRTKFETSYAITTLSAEEIAKKAPLSVADLIAGTPGLYVESSGGEIGNNVYSRGLPNDNYRYIPVLEDGLPVWEEGAGAFTNADIFYRVDVTTQSAQIVRGGSASITASNAPGGIVNILTKHGTRDLQGLIKLEGGDYDHYRGDFNISGPITDNLLFQIGGFYRADNGLRDPGFKGNKGGQLRAGLSYEFDNGGSAYLGYRKLNDRNIFYTAIPLASDDKGLPGLDAGSGTLVNDLFARLTVPDGTGAFTKRLDLTDGVHTDTDTVTLLVSQPFGDDWEINEKARYVDGSIDFNGLFSSSVANSQTFLDGALARLRAVRPDTVAAVYRDAATGATVAASDLGNRLALTQSLFSNFVELDNFINDLSVTKKLDTGLGRHNITAGWYFSQFHQTQNWNFNDIIVEGVNRPRYFDVVGVNAAGQQTIALTDRGLVNLHTGLQRFHDNVRINALYLTDSWQVTDKLRIDLGARYHHVRKKGTIADTATVNLGDASTIADDAVPVFTGTQTPYRYKTDQWAFSAGANYEFTRQLAAFARYSRSFRVTPEFQQWFGGGTPVENRIDLVEGGIKYSTRPFSAFVTLFYNKFPNIAFQTLVNGPDGSLVSQSAKAAAESKGVEVEFSLTPAPMFELAFGGNYQDISYSSFAGTDANGAFDFSGNRIVRQPKMTASIRPTLHLLGNAVDLYSQIQYTGSRFVDVANTIKLPSYTEVSLGANWRVTDRLSAQIIATNLFNEVGLTEGNPRAGAIIGTNEAAFQGRPIFGRRVRGGLSYSF